MLGADNGRVKRPKQYSFLVLKIITVACAGGAQEKRPSRDSGISLILHNIDVSSLVFCSGDTMAIDPVSQMLSGVTNIASQQADYPPAV